MARRAEGTRERIVDAAIHVLAHGDGFTMRDVARQAGVAVGLAHYYFDDRESLVLEVVKSCRERFLAEVPQLEAAETGAEIVHGGLRILREIATRVPEWYRILARLDALGMGSPSFARAAARVKSDGQENIAAVVRLALARDGRDAPGVDALAAFLLAAFDGIAQRKLLDPKFDVVSAYAQAETLLLDALAMTPPKKKRAPKPSRRSTAKRRRTT